MTKQPEALRLADGLEQGFQTGSISAQLDQAAAELRRLHDVNTELVEALKNLLDVETQSAGLTTPVLMSDEEFGKFMKDCVARVEITRQKARTALAKATGEQQ